MLDSAKIINEAKNQTGLNNFGNPLFLEGFETLIKSINQESDLNDIDNFEQVKKKASNLVMSLIQLV